MLLCLFYFLVLTGLVAAGHITCTPLWGASGNLMIQSTQDGDTLPPPVQIGIVNDVLQEGTINQRFIFQNCSSPYVSQAPSPNPSQITVYYGWEFTCFPHSDGCVLT